MSIKLAKTYASVWKAENKGKYLEVQMSTGRRDYRAQNPDQVDDKNRKFAYANSSWSFVSFVGNASKKGLENRANGRQPTRIEIPEWGGEWTLEPYLKDGKKVYPKSPRLVVWDFEYQDEAKADVPKEGGNEDEFPF